MAINALSGASRKPGDGRSSRPLSLCAAGLRPSLLGPLERPKKELETFHSAFISKHSLYGAPSGKARKLSPEEREELERMAAMAEGMRTVRVYKPLPEGRGE